MIGEDYVECSESQDTGELPPADDALPIGAVGMSPSAAVRDVDVRLYFETYPSWSPTIPLGLAGTKGRLTGASDRGQRSVVGYDARGNAIYGARMMALLPAAIPLSASGTEQTPPTRVERVYDTQHLYTRTSTFDFANRATQLVLPADPDHPTRARVGGRLEYDERGLPYRAHVDFLVAGSSVQTLPLVADTTFDFDGAPLETRLGGPTASRQLVSTMTYDLRRRPTRSTTTRTPKAAALMMMPVTDADYLGRVSVVADTELKWDSVSNLTKITDHRPASEWPAGWRPRTITARHDALYRVTGADMTYGQGGAAGTDTATDWRTSAAQARAVDPMRPTPAPMLGTLPPQRANNISWSYDWLGNATEWTDDAHHFYERSIGDITNGNSLNSGSTYTKRPSALYAAHDLDTPDASGARGGYVDLVYGESGNATELTVYAQCRGTMCSAANTAACTCDQAQKYVYRWDELNRLVEGRRFDRPMGGSFTLKVRQRFRYDGANQRTVKETDSDEPPGTPDQRYTLYVHAGDYERRGLVVSGGEYVESAVLGTETQYLVGGARVVWEGTTRAAIDDVDGNYRVTLPVADLIGTVGAVWDVVSAELIEVSTYYPNGARETLLTTAEVAVEPVGFTGKEADEEIGLTYFGERWLIPRVGRWASADPAEIHAMSGGEFGNAYHYVGGNVLQARDQLGLGPLDGMKQFDTQAQFDAHVASGGAPTAQQQSDCRAGGGVCGAVVGAPGSMQVYHYRDGHYVLSQEASDFANSMSRSLETNSVTEQWNNGVALVAAVALMAVVGIEVGALSAVAGAARAAKAAYDSVTNLVYVSPLIFSLMSFANNVVSGLNGSPAYSEAAPGTCQRV